ncbi:MAG: cob(I)yrinic acid a,c-diamide adenosyltransferase [Atopostipes suicloacalis]|nr:cob(I)yrinic acid a,c-diamide adenosyltransferase [Atopostipes suicloacalis]MDN6731204.1 cob(I)yrinic acid a,c-diamide adenosyltransferase [Atopostipes suicloacalis]
MKRLDPADGLTLVYTGDGKGKTTASLGLAMRAAGREQKVLIIQFIKSPERDYGEEVSLEKLGIEVIQTGIGFTWTKTTKDHRQSLKEAWALTKERVMRGEHDLIILDEINNALAIDRFPIKDVLPLEEVLKLIEERPKGMHLVLTGRKANEEVIEKADLVSEVMMRKHYYEKGIPAVIGLEL